MDKIQFDEWVNDVQCGLFHVHRTDLDDTHGVRVDQLRVINMITETPEVLKHQSLKELLIMFDVLN